jgi:hypothetical protein
MKFIWEESDIWTGRKYSKADIQEVWMLGYFGDKLASDSSRYASVSLADGCICKHPDKETLLKTLNAEKYVPVEFLLEKK